MICTACNDGRCISCEPIPDPEREQKFFSCDCLHDDDLVLRAEQVRLLLAEAQTAHEAGRDDACVTMLGRALQLLRVKKAPPIRKLALVAKPSYAQQSGEALPEWMARKHGDRR